MPIINTLSGTGSPIDYRKTSSGYQVKWGSTSFSFTNTQVEQLLTDYFQDPKVLYPLGADMVNPTPGGMGEYLKNRIRRFTPRHASAIAAILVNDENQLSFKTIGNAIYLRKTLSNV